MFFFQLPTLPERWLRSGDFSAGVRMLETANPGTFNWEDLRDYKRAWSAPASSAAFNLSENAFLQAIASLSRFDLRSRRSSTVRIGHEAA